MEKTIKLIVAHDSQRTIGHGISMPGWHLTDDFDLFKKKTIGCALIMGRKTAIALQKPLKGRTNIVLSKNKEVDIPEGFLLVTDMASAIALAKNSPGDIIWIAGGGQIYKEALDLLPIDELHITVVDATYPSKDGKEEIKFPEFSKENYEAAPKEWCEFKKRSPSLPEDKGNTDDFIVKIYRRVRMVS